MFDHDSSMVLGGSGGMLCKRCQSENRLFIRVRHGRVENQCRNRVFGIGITTLCGKWACVSRFPHSAYVCFCACACVLLVFPHSPHARIPKPPSCPLCIAGDPSRAWVGLNSNACEPVSHRTPLIGVLFFFCLVFGTVQRTLLGAASCLYLAWQYT